MNVNVCHQLFLAGDKGIVSKVLIQVVQRAAQILILPSFDKKNCRTKLGDLRPAKTQNALADHTKGLQMRDDDQSIGICSHKLLQHSTSCSHNSSLSGFIIFFVIGPAPIMVLIFSQQPLQVAGFVFVLFENILKKNHPVKDEITFRADFFLAVRYDKIGERVIGLLEFL